MWRIDDITRRISDVTLGTAIVIIHVVIADRLETRRQRLPGNKNVTRAAQINE